MICGLFGQYCAACTFFLRICQPCLRSEPRGSSNSSPALISSSLHKFIIFHQKTYAEEVRHGTYHILSKILPQQQLTQFIISHQKNFHRIGKAQNLSYLIKKYCPSSSLQNLSYFIKKLTQVRQGMYHILSTIQTHQQLTTFIIFHHKTYAE